MKNIIVLITLTISSMTVLGQERDLMELIRKDLQTEKAALITAAMQFTTEESAIFWPLYRDYEKKLAAIMDKRLDQINDYANNFDKMSEDKATELVKEAFSLDSERTKLLKKYFKKFSKELSPKTAARFTQVEHQILMLLDIQIAQNLPWIY